MARKPNYPFERMERERAKERKTAEKAEAKREARERERAEAGTAVPRRLTRSRHSAAGEGTPAAACSGCDASLSTPRARHAPARSPTHAVPQATNRNTTTVRTSTIAHRRRSLTLVHRRRSLTLAHTSKVTILRMIR